MEMGSRDMDMEGIYIFGKYMGFFAAFLLFASAFFLMLKLTHKISPLLRYYHVVFVVVLVYVVGAVILKLKK